MQTALVRLEELSPPPEQDGTDGSNRARGPNQLGVEDDIGAVRLFLKEYAASPATQRSYRKEIERLLLWALVERGKPLSSLSRLDFQAYAEFLRDPQPRERWCGPRRGRRGVRFSGAWRPFAGPLGPSACKTALVIVNSLMNYLVRAGYLAGNPLGLLRPRAGGQVGAALRSSRRQVAGRSLDPQQWDALLAALEELPRARAEERDRYQRLRFLLALLHFLALRLGEVERHRMGDFVEVRGRWLFCVVGKGQKEAEVPVNSEMLQALRQYREHLGLPPLPAPGEETPLLMDLRRRRPLGGRRINQLIKDLAARAAERLQADDPYKAERLRRASAHWFRHTALTRQAEKGIPLTYIKANARHAKLDTTLLYVHTDEDLRYRELEKHTWK